MIRHSLRAKILLLVGSGMLLATLGIAYLAHNGIEEIINRSQTAVYQGQLAHLQLTLSQYSRELEKTLQVNAYRDQFQEEALRIVRLNYMADANENVSPFILDDRGAVLLHRDLPHGDKSQTNLDYMQTMLGSSSGDFKFNDQGEDKWIIYTRFKPWNWIIGYELKQSYMYADLFHFDRTLLPGLVLTLIFISAILLYSLKRFLEPILVLTRSASTIAGGNLDEPILVKGQDEVGTLAHNFSLMQASIREKLQKIQSSENLFREFFNANPMATIISSPDGIVHMVNPAFEKTTGFSSEDVVGRTVQEMRFWRDPADRKRMLLEIEKKGYIDELEGSFFGKNDKPMTCIIASRAVNHEGELRIISIVHDITEKKQAEKELLNYRDHLEILVEEKTLKLKEAQAELLQRERLATLGQLSATISHEILNPLGTVRNALFNISKCLEHNDSVNALKAFEMAERNINRCVNIIEEMNGFARVKELEIAEIVLDDWLKSVLDEISLPEEIECTFDCSGKIKAQIDLEKLRQVVVNLINNAVHALQDKNSCGRQLKISTRQSDDHYEILFSDNGAGMSDETRKKIFEPLYSTKGFGVGLGMYIVKNIIEQHHGNIDIVSQEGQGTTITLRLPVTLPAG